MGRSKRWITIAVLTSFGALWLYVMLVEIRPWAVEERRQLIAEALGQGRGLMVAIGSPPEADTLGPLEERSSLRRGPQATLTQEFTVPGRFIETVAWYRARLEAAGWQPFDPANWADFHVDFCKAPWQLEIARSASFEEDRRPYHRLTLRLRWAEGFTADRCPYPGA